MRIKLNSLPLGVSSGSLRVSALSVMDEAGIPPSRMGAVSGHDLRKDSAMFEYIGHTHSSTIAGMYIRCLRVQFIHKCTCDVYMYNVCTILLMCTCDA